MNIVRSGSDSGLQADWALHFPSRDIDCGLNRSLASRRAVSEQLEPSKSSACSCRDEHEPRSCRALSSFEKVASLIWNMHSSRRFSYLDAFASLPRIHEVLELAIRAVATKSLHLTKLTWVVSPLSSNAEARSGEVGSWNMIRDWFFRTNFERQVIFEIVLYIDIDIWGRICSL